MYAYSYICTCMHMHMHIFTHDAFTQSPDGTMGPWGHAYGIYSGRINKLMLEETFPGAEPGMIH